MVGIKSYSLRIKSYEHIEYDMNNLIDNLNSLGNLNIEFISRNLSYTITQENYGIHFYNLFMNDNIFIPEKSLKTWYRYNFSFIDHKENDCTRIYYMRYISIIVQTCNSFNCTSCYENFSQCDNCLNSELYSLTEDNIECYPKNH